MAGFKTHIAVSGLVGVGYGAGAYALYGVPLPSCLLAGGLCGVAGMLPDLDSGEGRPLRESLSFAAAVISTMLVDRFQQLGLAMESIVLAAVVVYLLVRFGLAELLKRYTVHRGMFHSLPAAVIFAEIAFLLSSGTVPLRCYKAGAVALGYLTHLLLDELFSVHYVRGRMAFKRSFGTALKLFSTRSWWPNVSAYGKLALLTFLVLKEPGWMERVYQDRVQPATDQLAIELEEFLDSFGWYEEPTDDARDAAPIASETGPGEAGQAGASWARPAFTPNRNPEAPRTGRLPDWSWQR
ncbi:MAG: metal-dependent hydrolase [Thermoguttaceae bacterium]|jgi:membrane-bound metal-dependent hydrolase YbcI (DUF457 family)|nr:metal-dependent hydrolase [Thermoguttaceae bacterium]